MSASTTKTKNQPSRKPVLLDYLKAFTKDKLILQRVSSASPTASSKRTSWQKNLHRNAKAGNCSKTLCYYARRKHSGLRSSLGEKCFHPTYSEYALLLPFISMGYIVSYPDDCFEAVKEARTVYKKSTPQIFRLTANS